MEGESLILISKSMTLQTEQKKKENLNTYIAQNLKKLRQPDYEIWSVNSVERI